MHYPFEGVLLGSGLFCSFMCCKPKSSRAALWNSVFLDVQMMEASDEAMLGANTSVAFFLWKNSILTTALSEKNNMLTVASSKLINP